LAIHTVAVGFVGQADSLSYGRPEPGAREAWMQACDGRLALPSTAAQLMVMAISALVLRTALPSVAGHTTAVGFVGQADSLSYGRPEPCAREAWMPACGGRLALPSTVAQLMAMAISALVLRIVLPSLAAHAAAVGLVGQADSLSYGRPEPCEREGRMLARRSRLALLTTVIELVAMAISASTGCIRPTTANGIITTL